ncbi:MAG: hypothetical protein ACPG3U_07700 [Rhodothermales bacterium]
MPSNHSSSEAELTDQQFLAMGKLFVEWSNVEFMLGTLLSRIVFVPEILARTYTDQLSATRLEQAIKNAVDLHKRRFSYSVISRDKLDQLERLVNDASVVRRTRNKLAHYCWSRHSDNAIAGFKLSGRQAPNSSQTRDYQEYTLEQLKTEYERAYALVEGMIAFAISIPENEEERHKLDFSEVIQSH